MGRVYNETFDEQQQILYLSFGVPDFANVADFMKFAFDSQLATMMNTGDVSVAATVGKLIGSTIGTIITLPFVPLKFVSDLITKKGAMRPTKYYDFKQEMVLYFQLVNVILAHLSVNMHLQATSETPGTDGVPDLLKKHGVDILTILHRKYWFDKVGSSADSPNTAELLAKMKADKEYENRTIIEGLEQALTEAQLYVGFRLEKSTDSSESASNTTKQSEVAQLINSRVQAGKDLTFNLAGLGETGVGEVIKGAADAFTSLMSGLASTVSLNGAVEMLKGSGFIDVPEIWESSSFSKSYSFDFQLRTPYGDPISIFYSLYIPLAMLIAGAFPRSVGQNTYTSPFVVRAFCKGMFAIPMGIIDSITIKRGGSEYGWNTGMLPTQIDVSLSIKDLSPIMHIALADGGVDNWKNILGNNSSFQEYMMTLAGMNVAERSLKLRQIKNRAAILGKILANNKLNPMMIGFALGNTTLGRGIATLTPVSKLPGIDDLK
jgi:hypothetical protein